MSDNMQIDLDALSPKSSAFTRKSGGGGKGNPFGYIHTYHLRHTKNNRLSLASFFVQREGLDGDKGLKFYDIPADGPQIVAIAVVPVAQAQSLKGSKAKSGKKSKSFTSDKLVDDLVAVGLLDPDTEGSTDFNLVKLGTRSDGAIVFQVVENDKEVAKQEAAEARGIDLSTMTSDNTSEQEEEEEESDTFYDVDAEEGVAEEAEESEEEEEEEEETGVMEEVDKPASAGFDNL